MTDKYSEDYKDFSEEFGLTAIEESKEIHIEKTGTEGNIDIYTIYLNDGSRYTFNVTNGLNGEDGISPQMRINSKTNEWEISADNGKTWKSTGVKATGNAGKDGTNGKDGKDGADGKDGKNGTNGNNSVSTNKTETIKGKDGKDGVGIKTVKVNENNDLIVTLTND